METNLLFFVLFVGCDIVLLFAYVENFNETDSEDILFATIEEADTTENGSVAYEDFKEVFASNTTNKNVANSSPKLVNALAAKWQALYSHVMVARARSHLSDACRETAERMKLFDKSDSDCGGVLVAPEKHFHFSATNATGTILMSARDANSMKMEVISKKDCGLTSYAENGTIVSPEYPDSYPAWISCTWEIIAPLEHKILFTKIDFHMQGKLLCPNEETFLQIWDGMYEEHPMITRFDEDNPLPSTFISNSNLVRISSRPRICDYPSRGFKLIWKFQASGCNETLRASSGIITSPRLRNLNRSALHCNWRIIVNSGNIIQLTLLQFWATNLIRASCEHDYLEITDIDGKDISKAKYCYTRAPPGAIYTTGNEAVVSLVMSRIDYKGTALQLRFNAVCKRSLSGYKGTIESINYPHVPPPNLHCLWIINAWNNGSVFINLTNVNLNSIFHSLQILEPEQDVGLGKVGCLMDARTIAEGPSTCSSSGKVVLIELKTSIQMHNIGTGFRLEWEIYGCNKVIRSKRAIIQSSGYPERYPVSEVCEWKIVTEYGSGIELTIHDWNIENFTDCKFDGLKVFTGPPHVSLPILHLCGTSQHPSTLTSQLNIIYVQFYSDESFSFKGFNASFKQITTPKTTTCGEDHLGPTGYLYSPNFPNPYNNLDNCRWTITVHHNYLVALKLLDMDIGYYGCHDDNLNVYYDKAIAETPNEILCGKQISRDVISSKNVMTVTFQTDRFEVFQGFKSMFYEACGAKLNRNTGIIQSPTFLSMMNGASNCNWTIIASALESRVVLLFTDFYWPVADLNCNHHYIEVLAETQGNTPFYKGCCSNVPPVSVSPGNVLILRTTNAKDLTFKAFYFTVTEACLHILITTRPSTVVNGLVTFPREEKKPSCQQTLHATADNKQTIHVQFHLYQPEIHKKLCMNNFVAIHKNNFSEPPIHISCPKEGIPTIENESSYYWSVYVRLDGTSVSDGEIGTGKNTSSNLTGFSFENDLSLSGRAAAGNAKVIAVFLLLLCRLLG